MGNLPCCNSEERGKESALLIPKNSNGSHPSSDSAGGGLLGHHNLRNNSHGALSTQQQQGRKSSSASPQPPGANANAGGSGGAGVGAGGVPIDPSDPDSLLQLEERQRALHQEQERLERIVNDAGRDMVSVNGGGPGGAAASTGGMMKKTGAGAGSNNMMTMHMNGYYDAAFASEMWHCLIPSRTSNGPGGLISRCEGIMEEEKAEEESTKKDKGKGKVKGKGKNKGKSEKGSESGSKGNLSKLMDLRKIPKTCIVEGSVQDDIHHQVVDVLSRGGVHVLDSLNQSTWNEEVVRDLERAILDVDGKDSSSGSLRMSSSDNDGMEMILDDLAERFLTSVFREGGTVRAGVVGVAPIVENVL